MRRTSGLLLLAMLLGSLAIATAGNKSNNNGEYPWPRRHGVLVHWPYFKSRRPQPYPRPQPFSSFPIPSFLADDSESMEGKEEYKSGWYPDDWQRHYWCQKYFGSWKFCYYWWWYNGRYYYRRCSWNNCKGEKVKPYH